MRRYEAVSLKAVTRTSTSRARYHSTPLTPFLYVRPARIPHNYKRNSIDTGDVIESVLVVKSKADVRACVRARVRNHNLCTIRSIKLDYSLPRFATLRLNEPFYI